MFKYSSNKYIVVGIALGTFAALPVLAQAPRDINPISPEMSGSPVTPFGINSPSAATSPGTGLPSSSPGIGVIPATSPDTATGTGMSPQRSPVKPDPRNQRQTQKRPVKTAPQGQTSGGGGTSGGVGGR